MKSPVTLPSGSLSICRVHTVSQAEVPTVALEEPGRSGDPERDCPWQEMSFSSLGLEEAE